MRFVFALIAVFVLLSSSAFAMDTKAAGQCIALGALSREYQAKAEALLATAQRTGYGALVDQRVREEFAFLNKNKGDKSVTDGWARQAVHACNKF
jgi:hypothetical protein